MNHDPINQLAKKQALPQSKPSELPSTQHIRNDKQCKKFFQTKKIKLTHNHSNQQ